MDSTYISSRRRSLISRETILPHTVHAHAQYGTTIDFCLLRVNYSKYESVRSVTELTLK